MNITEKEHTEAVGLVIEKWRAGYLKLESENKELREKLRLEHENFLTAHRENMKAVMRIDELKKKIEKRKPIKWVST